MNINFPIKTSICTIHVEDFTSELPSSVHVFLVVFFFFFFGDYTFTSNFWPYWSLRIAVLLAVLSWVVQWKSLATPVCQVFSCSLPKCVWWHANWVEQGQKIVGHVNSGLSSRVGNKGNWPAVRIELPTCFYHLKESFSYKESHRVQTVYPCTWTFLNFCLSGKAQTEPTWYHQPSLMLNGRR